jgi:hypothetical protein
VRKTRCRLQIREFDDWNRVYAPTRAPSPNHLDRRPYRHGTHVQRANGALRRAIFNFRHSHASADSFTNTTSPREPTLRTPQAWERIKAWLLERGFVQDTEESLIPQWQACIDSASLTGCPRSRPRCTLRLKDIVERYR